MIRGELTNIRAIERRDVGFLTSLLNDPATQAGWGTGGVPVSVHQVETEIEVWLDEERTTRLPVGLVIEDLEHNQIGLALVLRSTRLNRSLATLSLAIATSYQRQGMGSDALVAITHALHEEWRIHCVQLVCEADNVAAIALYESVGFTREATKRQATFTDGAFGDQHVYSALPGEITR
jgi:RimJ/RimL family protein N-acetyltransferase